MKCTKKVENSPKKVFQPAFGCGQHPKAGQNTQHMRSVICDKDKQTAILRTKMNRSQNEGSYFQMILGQSTDE